MFVRLARALDFLTTRPEWDGKTLAVIGHSQGGCQALVAGGLDERVTFIGASGELTPVVGIAGAVQRQ